MKEIVKKTNKMKPHCILDLTRRDRYNVEKDCLLKLQKKFQCYCTIPKNSHFPIIRKTIKKECLFVLSDCGYSLDRYQWLVAHQKIKPYYVTKKDFTEQISCICQNLVKNNILHLDIASTVGKNLCLNTQTGVISLIDFDLASINNNGLNPVHQAKIDNIKKQQNSMYDQLIYTFLLVNPQSDYVSNLPLYEKKKDYRNGMNNGKRIFNDLKKNLNLQNIKK